MDVAGLYAGKIESWLNDVIPQMLKTLLPWTTCLISSVMGPRIPTSSQHWILIKCIYYLGRANSTLSLLEVYLSNSSQLWAEWSDYWRIMGKGFFYLTYFFIILTFCSSTFWASLVAQTVKNLPATQESWFDLWVGKIPWKREWLPTPVFLPRKFHGQRSLEGYSPWVPKESDTERLTHTHTHTHTHSTYMETFYFCCFNLTLFWSVIDSQHCNTLSFSGLWYLWLK